MKGRLHWMALALLASGACGGEEASDVGMEDSATAEAEMAQPAVLAQLWSEGQPAFGIFVPDERVREPAARGEGARGGGRGNQETPIYTAAGAEELGVNELYDFLFLNLEGSYDPAAVSAMAMGLQRAAEARGEPAATLLVRIPPIERDGVEVTRGRVEEIMAAGGEGVVFPHIRTVEEAQQAVSMVAATGANVWSPSNLGGDTFVMLMVEDPDAVAISEQIAAVGGYSVLACGIGSLRGALGGDAEAAEQGNQQVLQAAQGAGLPDMITANPADIEQRVTEGFLGLLMQVGQAEESILLGRAVAGR